MALPKQIKAKVALLALKDAADSDFGGKDEEEPESDDMKEQYKCPQCGHKGSKEDFEVESD